MVNRAIDVNSHGLRHSANGGFSDIGITTRGSNWIFAVSAVMFAATIAFAAHSYTKPRTHRLFHYIVIAATLVTAIAYFTMGSDLGHTPIPVQYRRNNPKVSGFNRQIFYVRYIQWFITKPLLLLGLLRTAALPWATIIFALFLTEVWVVCRLVGALVRSSYKWGFFAFSCAALIWLAVIVMTSGRKHARAVGTDVGKAYTTLAGFLIFIWLLYPIAWGLSEGGNVIAPDSEHIFYGILDLLSKVVFGALLIWSHRKIEPYRLGAHIRDYGDDPARYRNGHGVTHGEKTHNGAGGVVGDPVNSSIHTHPATVV